MNPENPLQKFSFSLCADEQDEYQMESCEPIIHPRTLDQLLEQLNDSDDMSAFVRGMRQAFLETLHDDAS